MARFPGRYLIGDLDNEGLLSSVSSIPILMDRQLCEAYFVIAIKELEKNNAIAFRRNLKQSISYGPHAYLESMFYLAKGELEKLSD